MCFSYRSLPPVPPMAGAAVDSSDTELVAADGTRVAAFAASASAGGPVPAPGIVVLPDVRGLHRYYEELALRFAEAGVDAVAIDYFSRTAGTGKRAEGFGFMRHVEQTRFRTLLQDVAAAVAFLREERGSRSIFTIGFCFGGRLAFVTSARPELQLAGVIGFYGWPAGPGRSDVPAPLDLASQMRSPVLGLFGGADAGIPAPVVDAFRAALEAAEVDHEIHSYPGAPHSFFDRMAEEFAAESRDAWRRVLGFVRSRAASAS